MAQAQETVERLHTAPVSTGGRRRRLWRLVPVLAAIAGTFVFHRYSILTGLDRVQGDPGDTRFIAFLLEHWNAALHGHADWRSPPIFYPVRGTLAYSDGLVAMGLLHAALRSALGVYAAMNAQVILLSLLSFAAAYALLARGFALSVLASSLGAYFFAFSWPRFAQLVHVQLQFTFVLPILALLALECARDGRALTRGQFAWRACAFVALLALLLATTLYYAVFFALGVSIAAAMCLAYRPSRIHLFAIVRQHAGALAGAGLLAVLLIGPVVAFYLPLMRESKGRQWVEVLAYLVHPRDLLWMGRENWVWRPVFARWPEAAIVDKWPEGRIGVGLAATVAWLGAALWAAATVISALLGRRRLGARTGSVCVLILTGLVLEALMVRVGSGFSLWWAAWKFFPGASGIRGVVRLQLVVTLAMAVAFGVLLDEALRPRRARPLLAMLAFLVAAVGVAEQVGRSPNYSGRQAEALSRSVGAMLPRPCKAAYVIGPPDMVFHKPDVDEAHFDPNAYLAANPDVAKAWPGTPWEHYITFGRGERRFLDPDIADRHRHLLFFYNYTIPLAATLSGVPVANGLSGWDPTGWHLFDVLAPDAREQLAAWLTLKGRPQSEVCVVPVRLDLPMLPDLPGGMLP